MKLKEYNKLTCLSVQSKEMVLSIIGKHGFFNFNKNFCTTAGLDANKKVIIFNDEDNPSDWYCCITTNNNGFNLQRLNSMYCRIKSKTISDLVLKSFGLNVVDSQKFLIEDKIEFNGIELYPIKSLNKCMSITDMSITEKPSFKIEKQQPVQSNPITRKRGRQPGYSPKKKAEATEALNKTQFDVHIRNKKSNEVDDNPLMESIRHKNKSCSKDEQVPLHIDTKTTIFVSPELNQDEKNYLIKKHKLKNWEEKRMQFAGQAESQFRNNKKRNREAGLGRQFNGKALAGIGATDYGASI